MPANLTEHQQSQVHALLVQYAHMFASNSNDLGRTNILTHWIETRGVPVRQDIRRVPQPQKEAVKKLLEEPREKAIISPSKSPWASPIVLVPKKDGSNHISVTCCNLKYASLDMLCLLREYLLTLKSPIK